MHACIPGAGGPGAKAIKQRRPPLSRLDVMVVNATARDRERTEDYFKRERKDCIKDGVRKATDTFCVLQILEHQNRYVLKQSFALYHPSCDSLFFKPEVSDGIAATMTNKKRTCSREATNTAQRAKSKKKAVKRTNKDP